MKTSKILTITAITFAISLSMNNFAFSRDLSKANIAVVDVQKVLESSPEISALNTDRKNKVNELVSFVEKARADVANEPNATKKKALEDSYNKELNLRKEALDKEYIKKVSDVDKNITALINSKASSYDLVLKKSGVIDGGIDITNEVIKGLK